MSRYLLDVNVLVALGFEEHEFFERVVNWVQSLRASEDEFATCATTELGFLRVLALPQYVGSIDESKVALRRLKSSSAIAFFFVADDQDASRLPYWVRTPKQITDGHLVQLARAHGAALATLNGKIPGAFVIPEKA